MLTENPKLKPTQIREFIMDSTDKFSTLESKVASGGRINAAAALHLTLAKRDGKSNIIADADILDEMGETKTSAPSVKRNVAFH